MLTYTGRRNLFGSLTSDSSTANLALGDTLMNEYESELLAKRPWPFLRTSKTFSSVASQQSYDVPTACERVLSLKSTVSGNTYVPKLSPSIEHWNRLNSGTVTSSDFPSWYFVLDDKIYVYPTPASAVTNCFTVYYRRHHVDLSLADYTTGTITTLANAAKAVTGNASSWTTGMAGLWFRITRSAAALKGDHRWYEVASVETGTTLTLSKAYEGTSLAAASAAYVIGEVGLLPEAYQKIPLYRALEEYFLTIQPEEGRADRYRIKADNLEAAMRLAYSNQTDNIVIEPEDDVAFVDPNDFPTLS